jgi:hypothetical protein
VEVDIGVGIQYGPWECFNCGWGQEDEIKGRKMMNDERWDHGLDQALNELTNPTRLTKEEFEQRLLTNQPEFAHFARLFMDERADGMLRSFLGWSWEKYSAEHTPAHIEAWITDKEKAANRPTEYNFPQSWEQEIYGEGEGR